MKEWKVPFREVYCPTFKSWMKNTIWCLFVIKVFPQAVDLSSDPLVPYYFDSPDMFFDQYQHHLREIDRDTRLQHGGEWPAPPPGCA